MKFSRKFEIGLLVVWVVLVGGGLGYYMFKVKDQEVRQQRVSVEAEKEEVMSKPVEERWDLPILKRVFKDHGAAFYDLHGKFVELKPVGSNEERSLWMGKLELWESKVRLKVLIGIASTQGKPMIAFARYENNWRGNSTQIFSELPRTMKDLVKVGDEVVVRVKFVFPKGDSPRAMKERVEAMKELDKLIDDWDKVRKEEKELKPMFYAERVGVVDL